MVVTIHGNVCLCINLSGEDIFKKNNLAIKFHIKNVFCEIMLKEADGP